MMTRDRARKAMARKLQDATGVPYTVARRRNGQHVSPLAEIMRLHPQLGDFGIGVYDGRSKSESQRAQELVQERAGLARREPEVLEVAAWLRANIAAIATPGADSYGLKHLVERQLGRYVSNGEAIAAALIVGYPYRYEAATSPNVEFAMSKRDWKRFQR